MSNKNPAVFVFCALACEAKPLIDAWKLSKQSTSLPFTTYSNASRVVVISGIGKAAMAGAIGYTLARFPEVQMPIMINFGIAGHVFQSCGEAYLANKITDSETGKRFYPQLAFSLPCATSNLISYPKPETTYETESLYDMEASAFYETAIRFSSCELVHCLKVVSDNRQNPASNFNEANVVNWCTRQLPTLDYLLDQLQKLQQTLAVIDMTQYQQILDKLHFSATSSVKLRTLLQRWDVLKNNEKLLWRETNPRNGKELLTWLEKELDDSDFYL
jgi:hypothetical protein